MNISTPICTSLIEMANAALQTDFRKVGRSLEKLGVENVKAILEQN